MIKIAYFDLEKENLVLLYVFIVELKKNNEFLNPEIWNTMYHER